LNTKRPKQNHCLKCLLSGLAVLVVWRSSFHIFELKVLSSAWAEESKTTELTTAFSGRPVGAGFIGGQLTRPGIGCGPFFAVK
jgi:hypothetical protein